MLDVVRQRDQQLPSLLPGRDLSAVYEKINIALSGWGIGAFASAHSDRAHGPLIGQRIYESIYSRFNLIDHFILRLPY
jgi:hypothetical protein